MKDVWTGLAPGERPFRRAAPYYAAYRYRPSDEFVRLLARRLGWTSDDRVLDLGAGPAHVSLLVAPHVGEVVALEPEEEMVEEGRKRLAATGVENVTLVLGGSDDLPRLASSLGDFAAVTISQAFHWMRDQDEVLRRLDPMLDADRGAVALIGYVKEPDYNRAWFEREPWNRAEAILRRHLAGVPEGPNPRGRHDEYRDILARSPFSEVDLLTHEYELVTQPSVDAAIGVLYSLSNTLDRLGDRRVAFEDDVRQALANVDTAPIRTRVVDSALTGRRPTPGDL